MTTDHHPFDDRSIVPTSFLLRVYSGQSRVPDRPVPAFGHLNEADPGEKRAIEKRTTSPSGCSGCPGVPAGTREAQIIANVGTATAVRRILGVQRRSLNILSGPYGR